MHDYSLICRRKLLDAFLESDDPKCPFCPLQVTTLTEDGQLFLFPLWIGGKKRSLGMAKDFKNKTKLGGSFFKNLLD